MFPLVIVIGVIIIVFNLKGIKKESQTFNAILNKEKVNENRDYDKEIILIRKDLAETVMDLQKEIEEVKKSINEIKKDNDNYINKYKKNTEIEEKIEDYELEDYEYIEKNVISEIDFSNKIEEDKDFNGKKVMKTQEDKVSKVKKLIESGLNDDEICSELSIGKGEVLLIKSLLK